jgi:very-short-patch-repair endonuclease
MSIREDFERRCILENSVLTNHHRSAPISSKGCRCGGGCGSVLECEFWYWLRKTELGEKRALRQFQIGPFRVDCLIECGTELVVIELDGREWHQDKNADFLRDTELLRHVDAVIRIPYPAMHYYPDATMEVLGTWYARLRRHGCDIYCIHASEIEPNIARNVDPYNSDFDTREKWIEYAEPNYDVWYVEEFVGWAASIKGFLNSWRCAPIVLRHRSGVAPYAGPRQDSEREPQEYTIAEAMRSVIEDVQLEIEVRKKFLNKEFDA